MSTKINMDDIRTIVSEVNAETAKALQNKFSIIRLKTQELIQKVDNFKLDTYKEVSNF